MRTSSNHLYCLRRTLAVMTLASLLPLTVAAQALPDNDHEMRFAAAQGEYDVGHYAAAFTAFSALADAGHAQSARIALQMLRHGPSLYHVRFTAGPKQMERWANAWQCGGEFQGRGCLLSQKVH